MPAALRPLAVCLSLLAAALLSTPGRAEEPLPGKICYALKSGEAYALHVMDADGKNDRLIPNQPGAVNFFPAWSPDGKAIAYLSADPATKTASLHTWNLTDKVDSRLMDLTLAEGDLDSITLPCWSPDGRWLVISQPGSDGKPALWRVSPAGKMPEQITPQGEECSCPAWSRG